MSEKFEKFLGIKEKNVNVQEILNNNFRGKLSGLQSMLLPENKFMAAKSGAMAEYGKMLEEYVMPADKIKEYNDKNPLEIKNDFVEAEDPNIGWKFHLNVKPENVDFVSDYLIKNGYDHKYLSGGEIEEGKIFTMYVGSYNMAKRLAQGLSHDLYIYLCKPGENQEVEFAAGVVGRFVASKYLKNNFNKYGTCGFSLKEDDLKQLHRLIFFHKNKPDLEEKKKKFIQDAEEKAYKELQEIYGDYFFKAE